MNNNFKKGFFCCGYGSNYTFSYYCYTVLYKKIYKNIYSESTKTFEKGIAESFFPLGMYFSNVYNLIKRRGSSTEIITFPLI